MALRNQQKTTRFAGADWADQIKSITLIGVGGIGSWTALNLSRIGHSVYAYDGDVVDATNVTGGQMYKNNQIGTTKVQAMYQNCREFGSYATFGTINEMFDEDYNTNPICITGLDNMASRKTAFEVWRGEHQGDPDSLFIDGRLLMENMEILTIPGDRVDLMEKYEKEFLFSDESVPELDCTTKQSTFAAMIIAGLITATLCNFLTNRKLGVETRDVPFHQKLFLPLFKMDVLSIPVPQVASITILPGEEEEPEEPIEPIKPGPITAEVDDSY